MKLPQSKTAAVFINVASLMYILSADALTAYISQPVQGDTTTLLGALTQPNVTQIVLLTNYTLGDEFNQQASKPLKINRNITITSNSSDQSQDFDSWPVLDLELKRGKIILCSTCIFKFENLVVANERQGTGAAYDIFIGEAGSTALGHNIIRWRLACTNARGAAEVAQHARRSKILPNSTTGQQLFTFADVTFHGRTYDDAFIGLDFAMDIDLVVQEARGPSGGYAVSDMNMTRLCKERVTDECLQRMSPDACVNDLMYRIQQASQPSPAQHPSKATLAAAIAAPIIVVTAAAAAAAAFLFVRRKRRKQQLFDPENQKQQNGSEWADVNADASWRSSGDTGMNKNSLAVLGGKKKGWELTSTLTTPLLGEVTDSTVQFGHLLGVGSFGKVYRARWAGQLVAVKVIEHDTTATEAVVNEVRLLLGFNHPNIVRAYHCVSYTHTGSSGRTSFTDSAKRRSSSSFETPAAPNGCTPPAAAAAANVAADAAAGRRSASASSSACSKDAGSPVADPNAPTALMQQQQQLGGASVSMDVIAGAAKDTQQQQQQQQEVQYTAPGRLSSGGPRRVETWLVTEYCDLGTLHNVANQIRAVQDEPPTGKLVTRETKLTLLLLLQDVANGLKVLHSQQVVHGDLNSRNVLVSSSAVAQYGMVAKLADLGLSRVIKQHKTHRTTQTVGTMNHMAPEVLHFGRVSAAADIFSFGIMMWEVFTGLQAFRKLHYGQFFEAIVLRGLRPPVSGALPGGVLMLMERCWAADPADRPTASRLLELLSFLIKVQQQRLADV